MPRKRFGWPELATEMWRASWEAQQVMALRLTKILTKGASAGPEIHEMIAEKTRAALETQQSALRLALKGHGGSIPRKTVSTYRRKVRANRRRLLKEL